MRACVILNFSGTKLFRVNLKWILWCDNNEFMGVNMWSVAVE